MEFTNRASRSEKEEWKFNKSNQNEWAIRTNSELYGSNGSVISEDNPLAVLDQGTLVPDKYDYIALTYVSGGNGVGELETATYKSGGSGGSLTHGGFNIFIGTSAGRLVTGESYNIAIGRLSIYNNNSGSSNVGLGDENPHIIY